VLADSWKLIQLSELALQADLEKSLQRFTWRYSSGEYYALMLLL